jgi:hypothetical protein
MRAINNHFLKLIIIRLVLCPIAFIVFSIVRRCENVDDDDNLRRGDEHRSDDIDEKSNEHNTNVLYILADDLGSYSSAFC